MATRSNAGRGSTVDRGMKTHQQVFEEHINANYYGDTKSQAKIGRYQWGQNNGMNSRESRISNRINSASLPNRGIRKSGRGYARQDWILHHRKIVERADQHEENSVGNKKMVKLTEVLRLRQNNLEQKVEQMENEPAHETSMEELYVLAEVQVQDPKDYSKEKKHFQQVATTGLVQDNEMEVMGAKDRSTQCTKVPRIDTEANKKEAMDVEIIEVHEQEEESSFALLTQADKEKAVTTVAIKKEVLEEEATGLTAVCPDETCASDTSMGSESDNNWYDSNSSDTNMSNSDSPVRTMEDNNVNKVEHKSLNTVSTVKRKSVMYESTTMQKKLHVSNPKERDGNNKENGSETNSVGNVTKEHLIIDVDSDKVNKVESELNPTKYEKETGKTSRDVVTACTKTGHMGKHTGSSTGYSSVGTIDTNEEGKQILVERNQVFSSTPTLDTKRKTSYKRSKF